MAQNKKKQPKKTIQLLSIESVQDLLDRGKIPMALEAVKSLYKLDPSPAVEDLMAKVYHARIQQLIDSSLVGEANQLISVASQKCPRHRVLFQSAQDQAVHFPLTQEDVDSLVQKLDDPILAQQDRDTVEALFIKGLSDPRLFIQSKQIPPNHPLRQQALWIWEALQALGPNGTEEDRQTRLARLAQVPRRSFLASWCFFIRALQALYEKDIPRASQMLSRIPPESSLTDAKKVLEAKCDGIGHPQGLSSKATRDLWRAMNSHSLHEKIQGLRTLLHQEKFTAFTQKFDEILTRPPFQDPYSSRLLIQDLIRGEEMELHPFKLIQLFMPYYTKWFSERGSVFFMLDYFRSNMLGPDILEESYLQLISNIHSEHKSSLSPEEMGEIYWEFSRNLEKALQMEQDMFLNQEDRVFQQYLLDFLQKTCKFVSYPECYAALFRVSRQLNRPKKEIDKILHDWRAANPTDCQPLLILLEEAKQRGAMVKAMKYLEEAEQIDRINQNVRQARFQLIWKQLHKHLNQLKFHLAQKDLSSVQGLEMPPLRKAIFDGAAAYLAYIQNQEFQLPSSQDPFFFTLLFWHMHMSLPTKTTKEFEKDFPTPLLDRDSHLQSYFLIQDALRMLRSEER
ncbi:MAG: hypothetical protein RBU29_01395, partial [bacterium]|nr:hypothetical protein [bacterium]